MFDESGLESRKSTAITSEVCAQVGLEIYLAYSHDY